MSTEAIGILSILSVGHGDTTLAFNSKNTEEVARAKRIVQDLLKRGYAILVQVGKDEKDGEPIYRRARAFDPETCEYIIAGDLPPGHELAPPAPRRRGGRARKDVTADRRVSARKHGAVAVGRVAGG